MITPFSPLLWSLISGALSASCDVDPARKEDSKQNFVVTESYHSMNLEEANGHIFKTNVMILVDVASRQASIIYKGEIVESFPIVIGSFLDWNISKTRTPLGLFTVHGIDYCPPWDSAPAEIEGAELPCSKNNRLGGGAFWFRGKTGQGDFVYAFHTRHPQDQREFVEAAKKRDGSRGCVVASDKIINKLFNLLFLDRAFILPGGQLHNASKEIKKYIDPENKEEEFYRKIKNIYIAIEEPKPKKEPRIVGRWFPGYVGPPVKIDFKVMIIDTNNPKIPLSEKQLKPQTLLIDLLHPKADPQENPELFLATNCLVTKETSIFSSSPDNTKPLSTLSPGDKLIGVYRHSLRLSEPIYLEFWNQETKQKQEGQIRDPSSLKCNIQEENTDHLITDNCDNHSQNHVKTQSYWSKGKQAKILKCSQKNK